MKKKKNNGAFIGLLIGIIIMLLIVVGLFATNTISFNTKEASTNNQTKENKEEKSNKQNNNETKNEKEVQNNNREELITKLKEKLTDETWIKENLYSKENCFGEKVNNSNQELKFEVLKDNDNNPIVIVSDYSFDNFIVACYKVYIENNEVVAKNVDGKIGHPSHIGYSIDKTQGLVISTWGHRGDYKFTAYDIKNDEIKVYDEYTCNTGQCEYEYKGDKTYNITEIDKELTPDNINNYLK